MPDITLYGIAVSAFVAKVRIVLDMKGLDYAELPPPAGYGSPEYRATVPSGSVPGMVIDGAAIHDSNAIIELLEEIAPSPPLLPPDPIARAKTRALLGFHDTRVEAAARALFPLIKGDWRAEPDAVKSGTKGINAALLRLEEIIAPAPFINGRAPSVADIAYPVTIQMARMMLKEMEQTLQIPDGIAAWHGTVSALPAVARSLEIAHDAMEGWLVGFRR
ncbi:MAG: glutathione S-transferase family protein [Pseudomonadota bacterium]